MLKRKIISKISIGLLTSAALFSFILPTNEANAGSEHESFQRSDLLSATI